MANQAQIYVEPPWEGGMKAYINGAGHMTKMAACPYMVKTLKIFSRTRSPLILKNNYVEGSGSVTIK